MRKALGILLILVSVILSACAKSKERVTEDKIVTAYKMIDNDQEEEAAKLIEGELANTRHGTPEHARLTVCLASAYAHRADIKAQRFVKVLEASKIKIPVAKPLTLRNDPKIGKAEAIDEFLGALAGMIVGISRMSEQYAAIPTVKPEDEPYLEHAIKLLKTIPDDVITPGDALYRAVLNVIYLKHYIGKQVLSGDVTADFNANSCTVDFEKITGILAEFRGIVLSILEDMQRAQPSKKKNLQEQQIKVARSVADLTNFANSVSLIDEVTQRVAKSAVVQSGMQKLLKCTTTSNATASATDGPASAQPPAASSSSPVSPVTAAP